MTETWEVLYWGYSYGVVKVSETCIFAPNHENCSWLDRVCSFLRTVADDYRHMHPV